MKKMQITLVALGLALAATGCATHTINYKNPSVQSGGATQTAKQSFYLWGLVGGSEVDLDKMCPTGVAQIQSKTSVGDQVFTVLTGGIYSPMSVNVQCATGGAMAKGGAQ
ncbi:MAG: Bor/Iss family lipoprotein [Kofleriaceae bacterium]